MIVVLAGLGPWDYASHTAHWHDVDNATSDDDSAYEQSREGIEKGGRTLDEYRERQAELASSRGTYYGDICTVDRGGRAAGRRWAEYHGIDDSDNCYGRSWSFEEGCRTYAEEQQREHTDADDEDQ